MSQPNASETEKPAMSQREFLRGDTYLPQPLRDFHDQKDVFKSLHEWMKPPEDSYIEMPNWVAGQCYVIDYFLKFMAAHGWTMQRSRSRVEFASLAQTIKARRDREIEVLRSGFAKPDKPDGEPSRAPEPHTMSTL